MDCNTVDAVSCTGIGGEVGSGSHAGGDSNFEQQPEVEAEFEAAAGEEEVIDPAEFEAALNEFSPAHYPNNMALSALVTVSGVVQANGTLVAMEENSDTIRGVQNTPSFPPFGAYANQAIFQIMLYGTTTDRLRFVFVSDVDYRVAHLQETVSFVVNGNEGSATEPVFFSGSVSTSSGGGTGEQLGEEEGGQEGAEGEADSSTIGSGGGTISSGGDASGSSVYTFPAKSANLEAALPVEFYTLNNADSISALDLHAVHGCQTADGGYVMCGKGMESEESPATESFCIKYNGAGGTVWGWSSSWYGSDAANAVVPVSDTEVAVVGWKTEGTVGKRYITKLDATTGAEVWTTTDFANTAGTTSFFEMIVVDGNDVWLAGGINKPTTSEMSFKSYGNVAGGEAIVEKMALSALLGPSAPTVSDVAWNAIPFTGYLTAKVARPMKSGGNVAVLLFGELSNRHASLALISATDGSVLWGPTNYDAQGEGTDMQIAEDGLSVVIAGQGGSGELNGRLTKVAVSHTTGTHLWTKEYSSCGAPGPINSACNRLLILNECWGVTQLSDGGFALACGTGIEGCGGLTGQDLTDCGAGDGDKRAGAYKRGAGVWQSMVVRTDADGEQQWLRVDSYKAPEWPALGATGWAPTSSAAEWIMTTTDGGLAVITDQVSGTGLIKLGRHLNEGTGGGDSSGAGLSPAVSPPGDGSDLGDANPGSGGGTDDEGLAALDTSPGSSTAAYQYCGPGTEFVASSQKCEVTYNSFIHACTDPSAEGLGCGNVAMAGDC